MKIEKRYGHVLLIQSPVHHPAYAPPVWLGVAHAVGPMVERLAMFDAGLDYFLRVLSHPDHLTQIAALAREKVDGGLPAELTRDLPEPGRDLIDNPSDWEKTIATLPDVLMRLRSPRFFEPQTTQRDLGVIDFALALWSLAYHPCRFYRNGFAHAGLGSIQDVIDLSRDQDANPFWHYANRPWQPFSVSAVPDLALMCVTTFGQTLAAATLVAAWRRRWPDIRIHLCAPEGMAERINAAFPVDRSPHASSDGMDHLIRVAQAANGNQGRINPNKVLPAKAYLLPEQRGVPGVSVDDTYPALISQPLAADKIAAAVDTALETGRSLMVWDSPHGEPTAITKALYAASRRGIWNHVVFPAQDAHPLVGYAKANPNIIHSWCQRHLPLSEFSDWCDQSPVQESTYGDATPLPGLPAWMVLRDPVFIDAYLGHYGAKSVLRMRVLPGGQSRYQLGSRLNYAYAPPADLPDGYLDQIVRMVAAGGSVDLHFVRQNLERSHLIAYAEEQGVLIGNSCLKHPRTEYIEAVSQQIGVDLDGYLERGYTSVRPEYRGLGVGAKLLEGLTKRAQDYKIFSVIAEGNTATQKMAIRNRTRRVATFFSPRTNKMIGIWIPEWMLPEGLRLPEQPDVE